jgi:membrane carboxypeptidase/penicillin-binding protein
MSPVSTITGIRQVAVNAPQGVWIPRDERASEQETMTLREALLESNNAAAVLLQQHVGSRPILRLASDLGVRNQPDVPSLALGSGLVTPLELTAAYAVFPTLGYRVRPRGLIEVQNADGDRVHRTNIEMDQVLSPQVSFQMLTMLEDVIDRGTGAAARRIGVHGAVGGKTGTTNDYHDAWFVGFNSAVVVGVWVGYDQPTRIREGGTGARVALPIWADFMKRTAQRLRARAFQPPGEMLAEDLCHVSYLRPVQGCPTYTEYFKDGDDIPSRLCTIHQGNIKQRVQRAVEGLFGAIGKGLKGIFGR